MKCLISVKRGTEFPCNRFLVKILNCENYEVRNVTSVVRRLSEEEKSARIESELVVRVDNVVF